MKWTFIFLFASLLIGIGKIPAQSLRPYVVHGNDTIPCKSVSFGYTHRGLLDYAKYTDWEGNQVTSEAEEGLPGITSLCDGKERFDRVPIFPDKPDGPVWYAPRWVQGKVLVYHLDATYYINTANDRGGYYRFTFKMPDGKFYKVTQGNVNNVLKPFMLQCSNFVERYKGKFKADENSFYEMITIYNAQCK